MKFRYPVVALSGALLTLLGTGSLVAQESPPGPLPLDPVSFPEFFERTLSNGAQVIVVENHEQPVVTVNLRIKSGSAHDPDGMEGLAATTASLLNKGTTSRDSKEIAEAIDFMGASLSASAAEDWTSATTTVLTAFLDDALAIMSDVIIHPTFPEDELEIERKRALTGLQIELSSPQQVAQRRFLQGLYGAHPYSSLPTEESVNAMQRSDMVAFHAAHYRPGNALFVVAGDVSVDDVVEKLEKHFGEWAGGETPSLEWAEPPARGEREIHFYHKPGSVQASVRIGHLMSPATDPDWPSLDVALRILGGGASGWLFQVLREEKGYTYGARASAAKRVDLGYFQASAEVRNEVADSALAVLFELLDRIRDEEVPAEDLELAINAITGSFPRRIETPQQVAGQVATTRLRGLSQEYLESYRERVAAVDATEVQRVAQKHLDPDRSLLVVVGDAGQIYDKVVQFGEVHLFDVEGNAITLADLEVKASEVTFDPSIIEATTLVYSLNVQGNPMGESTMEVTRETIEGREIIRSRETTSGMGFSSEQDLVFDATTFQGIEVTSEQTMGGNSMTVLVNLEGRAMTGSVTGMDGSTSEIDTEVVEGTLLPGMDGYVIWLSDFENNSEIKVPAFNAQSAMVYTLTLKVLGVSTITVPAGDFEVYELEVSGAEADMKIFARVAAPHIVVKQEFAAQPVTLELKEIR